MSLTNFGVSLMLPWSRALRAESVIDQKKDRRLQHIYNQNIMSIYIQKPHNDKLSTKYIKIELKNAFSNKAE